MIKLLLFSIFASGYICAQQIEVVCEKDYEYKICKGDYSCEASKCLYKNTDIKGAYKEYILNLARDLPANEAKIYKKVLDAINTLKMNKPVILKHTLKNQYGGSDSTCTFGLKYISKDILNIEYNKCSDEQTFKVNFKQMNNDVEAIYEGNNGA